MKKRIIGKEYRRVDENLITEGLVSQGKEYCERLRVYFVFSCYLMSKQFIITYKLLQKRNAP